MRNDTNEITPTQFIVLAFAFVVLLVAISTTTKRTIRIVHSNSINATEEIYEVCPACNNDSLIQNNFIQTQK